MLLQTTHRKKEGIEILDLKGSLTFGQEHLGFHECPERLLQSGDTRVALNLDDLRELDSTGLGIAGRGGLLCNSRHGAGGGSGSCDLVDRGSAGRGHRKSKIRY